MPHNNPRIFIGSSSESLPIAYALTTTLERAGNSVDVWDGIFSPMKNILSQLLSKMASYDFAIFIFRPDDVVESRNNRLGAVRDNVIFEYGLAVGILGESRAFIVRPENKATKILGDLEGIKMLEYLEPEKDENNYQDKLRAALSPVAFTIQSEIEKQGCGADITKARQYVTSALTSLKEKPEILSNPCLKHLILTTFEHLAGEVNKIKDTLTLPASYYLPLLISLQEKLSPRIRSIAVVDQKEKFWRQDLGRKILLSVNPESERIFVFIDRESFTETWTELQTHAGAPYQVKMMDYAVLSKVSVSHKDLAIIELNQKKILAYYDNSSQSNIVYSFNPTEIENYEKEFNSVSKHALAVKYFEDLRLREDAMDELRHRLFSQKWKYDQKPVEMSRYLSIDKYDEFEELHPYRIEMINEMIRIFHERCREIIEINGERDNPWTILEFGAGTGLFTKRLAELPNVSVVAVEYDSVCYNKLDEKMKKYGHVSCMEEDSRLFDPGGPNKYDFIFSCFADHHIHDVDKSQYLENVHKNLEQHGLFIVGEEFLPRYTNGDEASRTTAIRKYHQHIIDYAANDDTLTDEQKRGIIDLETKAKDSGIDRMGDFKVSKEIYTQLLSKAKLHTDFVTIGPVKQKDVGGVYVVIASHQS
jgi:SAM-dependent methyltransferase